MCRSGQPVFSLTRGDIIQNDYFNHPQTTKHYSIDLSLDFVISVSPQHPPPMLPSGFTPLSPSGGSSMHMESPRPRRTHSQTQQQTKRGICSRHRCACDMCSSNLTHTRAFLLVWCVILFLSRDSSPPRSMLHPFLPYRPLPSTKFDSTHIDIDYTQH